MTAVSTVPYPAAAALRSCWHPVAYAADLATAPRASVLLGEPLVLWRDAGGVARAFRDFFASQPVADGRCVGYCLVARNYNLDQPDEVIQAFERTIFAQDQRVVESQRPDHVPFDLAAELHLTCDAVAVAYRRAMRTQGFS
jgi:phenylpropionate dioxygenase-like ring-hydroxylating dioxygenase large terminal subunit